MANCSEATETTRSDDPPHLKERFVERHTRVDQLYPVALGRLDHPVALFKRHRHGLRYDDVFARLGECDDMLAMHRGRRTHPDSIHVESVAKPFYASISLDAELLFECRKICKCYPATLVKKRNRRCRYKHLIIIKAGGV